MLWTKSNSQQASMKKHGSMKSFSECISQEKRGFLSLDGATAKQIELTDLSPTDFIIAVMGPTGSGKSTFISLATGIDTRIGHSLQSCTSDISIYKVQFPGLSNFDLVFVDTPGFDDTHKTDTQILRMISDWLIETYQQRVLLSGLLYLHRISDNRMAGTPLKNLHMFEKLCGEDMLHNVVLTTTLWEEVDEDTGEIREAELRDKYWKSMIKSGSTTRRLEMQTRAAAFRVLEPLLDGAVKQNSLLIQDELVKMRMTLPETAAGQALFSELEQLLERLRDVLQRMRQVMQNDTEDYRSMAIVKHEYDELKDKLNSIVGQMQELKLPMGKRLLKTLSSAFHFRRHTLP